MSPILQRLAGGAERFTYELAVRRPGIGLRLAAMLGTLAAQRASTSRAPSAEDVIELFGSLPPDRVQEIRGEIARLQFRNDALRQVFDRRGVAPALGLVTPRADPLLRLRAEGVPIVVTSWHQGPLRAISMGLRRLGVPALFGLRRPGRGEIDREGDVVRFVHLETTADDARFLKRAQRALEEGTVVGLPLDWLRDAGETVRFLGRRVHVGRGPAVLARLAGARVVPVTRRFLGSSSRIEVAFHPPIADADLDRASPSEFQSALLARMVETFEARIREDPGSLRPDRAEWLLANGSADGGDGGGAWRAGRRRARLRDEWEQKWASPAFDRLWLDRGISAEIQEAVASGWFVRGSRALDAGCGQGEVAAWLAEQGFSAVGVDVAEAAVARARAKHGERRGELRFAQVDLCESRPEGGPFEVVVDRGCFHQIPAADRPVYVEHLAAVCAGGARLLLLSRAFGDGARVDDAVEMERKRDEVMGAFAAYFDLERVAPTYLDRNRGAVADERLPGLAFWLVRRRG